MGRFVRTVLGMVFGLLIALAGLLAFKTYTIAAVDDQIWLGLNSRMPSPVRAWSCQTVEQRLRAKGGAAAKAKAPSGCEATWGP